MIKVGLTGGIGSGKSTAARLFQALGITVIDADQLAHALLAPDTPYFAQVVAHLGQEIVNADGSLDRAQLRKRVFADPALRTWLEGLLHPPILAQLQQAMASATGPYCVAVVPLLVEKQLMNYFDRIVVVDLPEATQQARVLARDRISPALLQQILNTQCTRAERLAAATDVLNNAGEEADLTHAIHELHNRFRTLK